MTGRLDFSFLRGAPVAVLGLGKSGLATALALLASGVAVRAWDDSPFARSAAEAKGVPLIDLTSANMGGMQMLVLSPGIPHGFPTAHPAAARARAARRAIVGDIELLYRAQPDAHYIGITGTNGKSTTTALIGHILAEAAMPFAVGGNIGTAALTAARRSAPEGTYVLEMSSYQLELIDTLVFDSAILLNITPDHLDRHGGMEGYIAAKERIFRGQTGRKAAIVGIDGEIERKVAMALAARQAGQVIPISVEGPTPGGVFVKDGILIDDLDNQSRPAIDLRRMRSLPGKHNWQNATAAYAAARMAGIAVKTIEAAMTSFPGLDHRQKLIRTIGKVAYVDDSKATNADAASKALGCYDRIYWIAGGRAKEGGLAGLESFMPRVAHAFLIGEAAQPFAQWIAGKAAATISQSLDRAVPDAHGMAQRDGKDGVVLLSPACASFDQFPNFEVRGRRFVELVQQLEPKRAEVRA